MIAPTDNDDPRFIALASRLLNTALISQHPAEVYLIRIDQWFDAKWLDFSGKAIGAVSVWHEPTTVPPFVPNRVQAETHFTAAADSKTFVPSAAAPLHRQQPSSKNLTRSISRISPDGIFFWYSDSTLQLDRGSLMLYRTSGDQVFSWYASFHRNPTWQLARHRRISPAEIHPHLACA